MLERHILIISAMYQRWDYLERCIRSVKAQNYSNYTHVVIDDASDNRPSNIEGMLSGNLIIRHNQNHNGSAVRNQYEALGGSYRDKYDVVNEKNCIVMLLDGDDYLVNNPEIFNFYNHLYQTRDADFTYGSMWSIADGIPLIAQPYPPEIIKNKQFREYKFNWNMPYTHLRTFRKELFEKIDKKQLQDKDGNWYKEGGDNAMFYALIEQARGDKIFAVPDIIVNYNDVNPMNDYKIHGETQNKVADEILKFHVKLPESAPTPVDNRLLEMSDALHLMPPQMQDYLYRMRNEMHINPKVIYDIGSCVLHWQRIADPVWSKENTEYFGFDAMDQVKIVHEKFGIPFHPILLGDEDGKIVPFYQNLDDPGGNSIYLENAAIAGDGVKFKPVDKAMHRLDTYVKNNNIPFPDLIKLDVQGSELDILKGCPDILLYVKDIIVEGQNVEYNLGAPKFDELKAWLEEHGWRQINQIFDSGVDADYHFHNTRYVLTENTQKAEEIARANDVKRVMIAVPTNKYIEVDTFKAIYDLDVPVNIGTEFQYSFGYQTDQVRNLIASWVVERGHDYLFFIDADIVVPTDALSKLLAHNVDIASGLYIQRTPETTTIELINLDGSRVVPNQLTGNLQEIGACGMGCCLIRREVLVDVGYPQFVYKSALDHKNTQPEDFYFCNQARQKGYRVWADTSINCSHIGKNIFRLIS
jgi:FkbM family methyltransferase